MDDMDLNLLLARDALLAEGNVTGAARRLGLSSSAMSRTLGRLRAATGDPLLVRAGRGLVPTPRAAELRARVPDLAREVRSVLSPQTGALDLATLDRIFTIRANEGFIERFSGPLVAVVTTAAPRAPAFCAQAGQGCGPAARGAGRSRDRRSRRLRAGGAHPSAVPRQLRRRGAAGTSVAGGPSDA